MEILIRDNTRRITRHYHTLYSVGDIVKMTPNAYGRCLQNSVIKKYFGIENPRTLKEESDSLLIGYPIIKGNTDEWKVIEIKSIYPTNFMILLRNRLNEYLVLDQYIEDWSILRLTRRHKGERIKLKEFIIK